MSSIRTAAECREVIDVDEDRVVDWSNRCYEAAKSGETKLVVTEKLDCYDDYVAKPVRQLTTTAEKLENYGYQVGVQVDRDYHGDRVTATVTITFSW